MVQAPSLLSLADRPYRQYNKGRLEACTTKRLARPGSGSGLNEMGQLAFSYTLADGRTGVAVATPVPEPGAAAIAAGSCLLLWRRRRVVRPAGPTR